LVRMEGVELASSRALSHFQGSGTLTHLTDRGAKPPSGTRLRHESPPLQAIPWNRSKERSLSTGPAPMPPFSSWRRCPRHRHPGGSGVVGVVQREQFSLAVFRRSPTSVVPDPATGCLLGVGGDLASRWWSCRQGR